MPTPKPSAVQIFGARMRDKRTELGLTQYDVAHDSTVDLATYGKLERGIGNPTLLTILRLSMTIGVQPGALLEGLAEKEVIPEGSRPFTATEYRQAARRRQRS